MIFSSLRTGAFRSGFKRQLHTSVPRSDVASSARNAAEGASKQLSGLAEKAKAFGKPLADRASSATGVNVSSYADSFMYNLRVAGALFKQVYLAEGLAPPRSLQVIQDAYKTMYARAIDSNWWTNLVKSGEWQKTAIYAIEAYGIFHIGQMIGRRHIVGYKIDKKTAHGDHH